MNPKITYAVAAILAGASCAATGSAQAADAKATATETNSEGLVEITVTAERRSQSMQDVPISMQALTAQTLQQLHKAVMTGLDSPDVKERFAQLGLMIVRTTPEEFAQIVKTDLEKFRKVIIESGIPRL